jgi:integrase
MADRFPLHTADHSHCPACEAIARRRDKLSAYDPELLFAKAADSWLNARDTKNARARYLKPRTIKTYKLELEALTVFFGNMRLCDITADHIHAYQESRSQGMAPFKNERNASHVNEEVRKLQKILLRANLWHILADDYERLRKPFDQPKRVMTKREEAHLFQVAASKGEFSFVYAYSLLSVSTSASGAELRGLRMMDVDLLGRMLQVNAESAKNEYRVRSIPLVDDALWAASSLVMRARTLGCTEPHHYLMPYRHGNRPYDPTRHMSDNGIQKRWNALREAAGMPWLTGHVLRYQCITKLAEGGVDKITAKKIAGHITDKMWEKYSQVRIESTREKMNEAFKKSSMPVAGKKLNENIS